MATTYATHVETGRRIFARILVGVDGSEESLEAARQAALLQELEAQLTLLSAWDVVPIVGAADGTLNRRVRDDARAAAEETLAAAQDYVAPYTAATLKLVRGIPAAELLAEIERDEDTLVAVGGTRRARILGILEDSPLAAAIHRSPCSVLVARPAKNGFPRRIVVGVDGSDESAVAYAAARYLAERFDAQLRPLAARGGKGIDDGSVAAITEGGHEEHQGSPVGALTEAAKHADLLVVGSRGLHGPRALGSVSERVAHRAACSTLIVRTAPWQRDAPELGN